MAASFIAIAHPAGNLRHDTRGQLSARRWPKDAAARAAAVCTAIMPDARQGAISSKGAAPDGRGLHIVEIPADAPRAEIGAEMHHLRDTIDAGDYLAFVEITGDAGPDPSAAYDWGDEVY